MTAAADGHVDIVKMLLQHNANVALKDAQGWKAADHAVMNGIHRYSIILLCQYHRKNLIYRTINDEQLNIMSSHYLWRGVTQKRNLFLVKILLKSPKDPTSNINQKINTHPWPRTLQKDTIQL